VTQCGRKVAYFSVIPASFKSRKTSYLAYTRRAAKGRSNYSDVF
jgi:hypothetical protein